MNVEYNLADLLFLTLTGNGNLSMFCYTVCVGFTCISFTSGISCTGNDKCGSINQLTSTMPLYLRAAASVT